MRAFVRAVVCCPSVCLCVCLFVCLFDRGGDRKGRVKETERADRSVHVIGGSHACTAATKLMVNGGQFLFLNLSFEHFTHPTSMFDCCKVAAKCF